jgi:hypothetical protein
VEILIGTKRVEDGVWGAYAHRAEMVSLDWTDAS